MAVLLPLAVVVTMANWLWAGAEAQTLGGTALGGYVADGRCFLSNHSTFTEVACDAWRWSLVHWVVTLASWPILLGALALTAWSGRPWRPARPSPATGGSALAHVERSGRTHRDALLTMRLAEGSSLFYRRVEFYADGLVLELDAGRRLALGRQHVTGIEVRRSDQEPDVVVQHGAPGLPSPVRFLMAPESEDWLAVLECLSPLSGHE